MAVLPETRSSLLLRLRDAGDVAAWDELLEIYGPLVYRLARGRGLQPADADDLVQEVFGAVARAIAKWLDDPKRGPFRAWLLRIARNSAINLLTRPKRRGAGFRSLDDEDVAAPSDAEHEEEAFDFEYRREVFRWAAAQVQDAVAPKTWRAFWETAVEQRAVPAVAAELEMTEGSVYIARSRVLARLRECVRRREESER
ncbi:MAG: sigma-70 family RNA polymerase sigma factor [Pirellulales bacterium]